MLSLYFYLGLSALIFATLGFLLHAFCFSGLPARAQAKEIEGLQEALNEKQKEALQAREEIIKTNTVLRSLEQQIRQRNEEMETLRRLAARQDQEISLLQRDAETLRTIATGSRDVQGLREEARKGCTPEAAEAPASPARWGETQVVQRESRKAEPSSKSCDATPWRNNLSDILGLLDAMEKEIDKQS